MSHEQDFIKKVAPHAVQAMKEDGILASLTIAQAILESDWGRSGLTKKANNLFGIKGSYKGDSEKMETTEYVGKKASKVQAAFRKYPSWYESIKDHTKLFINGVSWNPGLYRNLIGVTDYKRATYLVRKNGYATDPSYTEKLNHLIETYKLHEYDSQAEKEKVAANTSFPEAQEVLMQLGITDGSNPKDSIPREQVWEMIYRTLKKLEVVK